MSERSETQHREHRHGGRDHAQVAVTARRERTLSVVAERDAVPQLVHD